MFDEFSSENKTSGTLGDIRSVVQALRSIFGSASHPLSRAREPELSQRRTGDVKISSRQSRRGVPLVAARCCVDNQQSGLQNSPSLRSNFEYGPRHLQGRWG